MGNCLVTKLKANVDNSSLEKLGCIYIDAQPTPSEILFYRIIGGSVDNPVTISIVEPTSDNPGDGYFHAYGVQTQVTTLLNPSSAYYFKANSACRIKIENYYGVDKFVLNSILDQNYFGAIPSEKFKYTSKLTEIGCPIEGNIEYLSLSNKLFSIQIKGSNLYGDLRTYISNLINHSTELTEVRITLSLSTGGYKTIKFNNILVDINGLHSILEWESLSKMSIKVQNPNSSTKVRVYSYGYSDEEIATKTAAGGDWEDYPEVIKCD